MHYKLKQASKFCKGCKKERKKIFVVRYEDKDLEACQWCRSNPIKLELLYNIAKKGVKNDNYQT